MKKEHLTQTALRGVDMLGHQLEKLGITDKMNRHNLAAFLMAEQHHLEGEWDSLHTRLERYRTRASGLLDDIETEGAPMLRPVAERINRFRKNGRGSDQTD